MKINETSFMKQIGLIARSVFLGLFLSQSTEASLRPTMTFSCGIPTSLPQWQILHDIYTTAFDKLGYRFAMVYVNTKREGAELKKGDVFDGSCARKRGFIDANDASSVILINTPIGRSSISAWRYAGYVDRSGPAQLFSTGARVGYLRGTSSAKLLAEAYPAVTLVSFLKPSMGIKSLAAGRIDYWVGFTETVKFLIHQNGLGSFIVKVDDVGANTLYPFLDKKHQDLAGPLKSQLEAILAERGHLVE
jgi:ABC-type amino acid transport substrate-binding protein